MSVPAFELSGEFRVGVTDALRNARALSGELRGMGPATADAARVVEKALSNIETAVGLTTRQITAMVKATKTAGGVQLGEGFDKAATSAARARREVEGLDRAMGAAGRSTGGVSSLTREIERAGDASVRLGKSLAMLGGGAAALGVAKLTSEVRRLWIDGVKGAADEVERLDLVLKKIGANAGVLPANLDRQVDGMRQAGIQLNAAQRAITQALQTGIDVTRTAQVEGQTKPVLEGLARTAQNAAVIAGQNSSDTLSGLMHGIVTGQTDVIRYASGLQVSFEDAYQRMAIALRKNVSGLTEAEKTQARLNEVIRAGSQVQGAYEQSLDNAGKKLKSLDRTFFEITRNIGDVGTPIFSAQVDVLEHWAKALQAGTAEGGKFNTVAKSMSVDLAQSMTGLQKRLETAAESFDWSGMVDKIRGGIAAAAKNKDLLGGAFGAAAAGGLAVTRNVLGSIPIVGGLANKIPLLTGWQGAVLGVIASNDELRKSVASAVADLARAGARTAAAFAPVIEALQRLIDNNAGRAAQVIESIGTGLGNLVSAVGAAAPVAVVGINALGGALKAISPIIDLVSNSGIGTAAVGMIALTKALRMLEGARGGFGDSSEITRGQRVWLGVSSAMRTTTAASVELAGAMAHPGVTAEAAADRAKRAWSSVATGVRTAIGDITGRAAEDAVNAQQRAQQALDQAQRTANAKVSMGRSGSVSAAAIAAAQARSQLPGLEAEFAAAQARTQQAEAARRAARRAAGSGAMYGALSGAAIGATTTNQLAGGAMGIASGAMAGGMMAGPIGAVAGGAVGGLAAVITSGLRKASEESRKASDEIKRHWAGVAEAQGAAAAIRQIGDEIAVVESKIKAEGGTGGVGGWIEKKFSDITGVGGGSGSVKARKMADEVKALQDAAASAEAGAFTQLHDTYNLMSEGSSKVEREAQLAAEVLSKLLGQDDTTTVQSLNLTQRQLMLVRDIASETAQNMKALADSSTNLGHALSGVSGGTEADPRGRLYRLLESERNSAHDLTTLYERRFAESGIGRQVTGILASSGADAQLLKEVGQTPPEQLRKMFNELADISERDGKAGVDAYVARLVELRQKTRDNFTAWTQDTVGGIAKAGGTLKIDAPQAVADAMSQIQGIETQAAKAREQQQEALRALDQNKAVTGTAGYQEWRKALAEYDRVSHDMNASAEQRAAAQTELARTTAGLSQKVGPDQKQRITDAAGVSAEIVNYEQQAARIRAELDNPGSTAGANAVQSATAMAQQEATTGGASTAERFVSGFVSGMEAGAPNMKAAVDAAVGKASGKQSLDEQIKAQSAASSEIEAARAALGVPYANTTRRDSFWAKSTWTGSESAAEKALRNIGTDAGSAERSLAGVIASKLAADYTGRGMAPDTAQAFAAGQGKVDAAQARVDAARAALEKAKTDRPNAVAGLQAEVDRAEAGLAAAQEDFVRLGRQAGLAVGPIGDLGAAAGAVAAALGSAASLSGIGGGLGKMGTAAVGMASAGVAAGGVAAQLNAAQAARDSAIASATADRDSIMQSIDQRKAEMQASSDMQLQKQLMDAAVQHQRQMEDAWRNYYRQLEDMARDHAVSLVRMQEDSNREAMRFARDLRNFRRTDAGELLSSSIGRGAGGYARQVDVARGNTAGAVSEALAGVYSTVDEAERKRKLAEATGKVTAALVEEAKAAAQAGLIGRDVGSMATYVSERFDTLKGAFDGTNTSVLSLEQSLAVVQARLDNGLGRAMSSVSAGLTLEAARDNLQRESEKARALLTNGLLLPRDQRAIKKEQIDSLNQYVDALRGEAEAMARVGKIAPGVESIEGRIRSQLEQAKKLFPEMSGVIDQYLEAMKSGNANVAGPDTGGIASELKDTLAGSLGNTTLQNAIEVEIAWRVNEDSVERALKLKDQMVDAQVSYARQAEDAAYRQQMAMQRMSEDQGIAIQRMAEDTARALDFEFGKLEAERAQAVQDFQRQVKVAEDTYKNAVDSITQKQATLDAGLKPIADAAKFSIETVSAHARDVAAVGITKMAELRAEGRTTVDSVRDNAKRALDEVIEHAKRAAAGIGVSALNIAASWFKGAATPTQSYTTGATPPEALFDDGGWLMPGQHFVENRSGRPEPILTAQQWDELGPALRALAAGRQETSARTVNIGQVVLPSVDTREFYEETLWQMTTGLPPS